MDRLASVAVIVLSAHYDHVGVRNGEIFNGADDNASGTAAVLALAAYFRAHLPAHASLSTSCSSMHRSSAT